MAEPATRTGAAQGGGGGAGGDTPFFRWEFIVILPQQIAASGEFFQWFWVWKNDWQISHE